MHEFVPLIAAPFSPILLMGLSGLVLLALLFAGLYAAHRTLRRSSPKLDLEQAPGPQLPFSAFRDLTVRLKQQGDELEQLGRDNRHLRRESQGGMQELMSNLPSGVVFFDKTGLVQAANPVARTILGFAAPSGLRASELFRDSHVQGDDGNDLGLAHELVRAALEDGRSLQRKTLDYTGPDGQHRSLGVTISPLRNARNSSGLICLLTDLTAIRALEEELRQRKNLASLGEMAAGIAHEFKNSLATISGYAQMLTAGLEDPELRGHSRKILDEVHALTAVATEFLTFARPLQINRERVELTLLLEECIESLRVQSFPDVELRMDSLFPAVHGDPVLLTALFSNLLRNACEAIVETGQPGQVDVSALPEEHGLVQIQIRDTGSGVSAAVAEKIFIPFFTTKASGTGLGLAMVHKIVTAHAGSVVLADGLAGQTAFVVRLPPTPAAPEAQTT